MRAKYIEHVKASLDWWEVSEAFRNAFNTQSVTICRKDQLALLLAKSALETRRWHAVHNYNFGNVKANEQYEGFYTCFACYEIVQGVRIWFFPDGRVENTHTKITTQPFVCPVPPGHFQTRFRAYTNAYEGARAYVSALIRLFPQSWEAMCSVPLRPNVFVQTLKKERYFTGSEREYVTAVESLYNEYSKKLSLHDYEEKAKNSQEKENPIDLKTAVKAIQFNWYQLIESDLEEDKDSDKEPIA